MKLSTNGAKFIARQEGLRVEPYNDPVGFATIGIGHLLHRSRVTVADRLRWRKFTRTDAYKLLIADSERFASAIRKKGWKLTQAQFDALVSFTFNVGPGWLSGSTLQRVLDDAKRHGHKPSQVAIAHGLGMWDKAGGRTLPGLHRRRMEEAKLFNTGRYS